jgi:hypothetical protein
MSLGLGVQPRGRLVQEKNPGIMNQGPGEGRAAKGFGALGLAIAQIGYMGIYAGLLEVPKKVEFFADYGKMLIMFSGKLLKAISSETIGIYL